MMAHRKEKHPQKVRPCKDPVNCGLNPQFTKCWFIHIRPNKSDNKNQTETVIPTNNIKNWSNFQKDPAQPNLPTFRYCKDTNKLSFRKHNI